VVDGVLLGLDLLQPERHGFSLGDNAFFEVEGTHEQLLVVDTLIYKFVLGFELVRMRNCFFFVIQKILKKSLTLLPQSLTLQYQNIFLGIFLLRAVFLFKNLVGYLRQLLEFVVDDRA
jgi:hypothetical protein